MFLIIVLIFTLVLSGCGFSNSAMMSRAEAILEDAYKEDIEILYEPYRVTRDYFCVEGSSVNNPDIVFKASINMDDNGFDCSYVDALVADKLTKRQMEKLNKDNYYIYNFVPFTTPSLFDTSMSLEEYCNEVELTDFTTYLFYVPDDDITDVNMLYADLQNLYSDLPNIDKSKVQLHIVPNGEESVIFFVDDYRKEHYTIDFFTCNSRTSYYYVDTIDYENNILVTSKDEFIESLKKFYNSNSNNEKYNFKY